MIATLRSPWVKQSRAHFNPAVTITFYRLGKAGLWDAVFYCAAQLLGAVAGVALASLVLQGAPAHKAVRFAATIGIYGDTIALVAELTISFILMYAVLFTSDHEVLAPYTHHVAAILAAIYIAFESPLSGISTNPARTFGPALFASYWQTLWIYFMGPPLGMPAAAEVFYWPVQARVRIARNCITTTTNAASSGTQDRTRQRRQDDCGLTRPTTG
jgi:aquaporin Z